jgi:PQQ-like domain
MSATPVGRTDRGKPSNTGEIVWRRPLGSYDQVEAQGLKDAGAPNMGGSIVTAGGLVFIAATTDSKFRAFDSRTGKELWMTRLEATGYAVPMTYLGRDNKQYVVIAAGGTNRFRMLANTGGTTADSLIAFSLSGSQTGPAALETSRRLNSPAHSAATRASAGKVPEVSAASLPEGNGKAVVVRVWTTSYGPKTGLC